MTKKGLYEYLLDNYGANEVLNEAYNKITAKEITDQDAIDAKVKEQKNRYAEYSGSFETYAKNQGYSNAKAFEKEVVVPEAKSELLEEKYLDTEFNDVCKKYNVSYLKIVEYSKESDALKALKTVKNAQKNDIVENLLNLGDVKTDIESYYLKKYKFTVEDKKVKKQIKKISSKYVD